MRTGFLRAERHGKTTQIFSNTKPQRYTVAGTKSYVCTNHGVLTLSAIHISNIYIPLSSIFFLFQRLTVYIL